MCDTKYVLLVWELMSAYIRGSTDKKRKKKYQKIKFEVGIS